MARPSITKDWFIGFLEGEGSFTHNRNKNKYGRLYWYPVFSIAQKDRGILETIRDFLGFGRVNIMRKRKKGKTYIMWQFRTQDKYSLRKVIDLVDGQLRTSAKLEQYEEWRKRFDSYIFSDKRRFQWNEGMREKHSRRVSEIVSLRTRDEKGRFV